MFHTRELQPADLVYISSGEPFREANRLRLAAFAQQHEFGAESLRESTASAASSFWGGTGSVQGAVRPLPLEAYRPKQASCALFRGGPTGGCRYCPLALPPLWLLARL